MVQWCSKAKPERLANTVVDDRHKGGHDRRERAEMPPSIPEIIGMLHAHFACQGQRAREVAAQDLLGLGRVAGGDGFDQGDVVGQNLLQYIPFPDALRGKYQCFTEADLSALREAGCQHVFADVQTGVAKYVQWLHTNQ